MSSLRRDLFERRLWPVVTLLLLAVVAIPMFLLKRASADGTPTTPPPPAAVTAQPGAHAAKTVPAKLLLARLPRNPFASGMPKLDAKPSTQATAPAASSSSTTTTASSSTATTPVSMVSPSPASTSSPSSVTTSTTAATPTTAPTSPIASTTARTAREQPAQVQSWTMYSVWLRFGKDTTVPVRTNVARLTPLPSVKQPDVMFMGVMAGGRQAVFALRAGLQHAGPGLCRPDRAHCSAILLQAGQTEHITVPATSGAQQQQLILRLVHIASHVTHSRKVALAAYQRHSAAGLCELDLADPVSYSQSNGTVSSVATAACRKQSAAVPFRYVLTFP